MGRCLDSSGPRVSKQFKVATAVPLGPANYREQQSAGHQHDFHQRRPLLHKYVSHAITPASKSVPRQVRLARLPNCVRSSGRALPFHHHRHPSHLSFMAVLGIDVLQHRAGGQRSWVPNISVGFLDALCVSASKTAESSAPIVSTDAVHHN
jgi:hypothetical protein